MSHQSSVVEKACEKVDLCKKATGLHPEAISAAFLHIGINNAEQQNEIDLLADNIKLRFLLYGSCNEEKGQYISFVDESTNMFTSAKCKFNSVEEETIARRHVSGLHGDIDNTVSYSHPCYEQEGQVFLIIGLIILIVVVGKTVYFIVDSIQISGEFLGKKQKDLNTMYMRSSKRT